MMWPKYATLLFISRHFSGLTFKPTSRRRRNTSRSRAVCSSAVLPNTMTSSRYTKQSEPTRPLRAVSMSL
ncbi:hypothetical protein T12_6794 [Trichinella patagoniensis]|uniref:Uncharacterized protein n=1 Tax=Trichinella patagoniensis TaxID=990121 RepID=A0A0V0ZYH0_9BILA|nr:hypothetical protein T12_6794 [Trichinella patagoniensis]